MQHQIAMIGFVVALATSHGCSSSSFNGSSGTTTPATQKNPSSNGQAVQTPLPIATPFPSVAPVFPPNSVTKGSFTVWATPPNPAPGQSYAINVSVVLPSNVFSLSKADLSGTLIGTDGYQQSIIPIDAPGVAPQTFSYTPPNANIPGSTGTALLIMRIPGAMKNVKDTLTVSSAVLQENQTISIIFQ